jgi:hypothetical protein
MAVSVIDAFWLAQSSSATTYICGLALPMPLKLPGRLDRTRALRRA